MLNHWATIRPHLSLVLYIKTEYKVLYSNLLESQAASVIEALDVTTLSIQGNQSSTVLVPEEHLDELRVP